MLALIWASRNQILTSCPLNLIGFDCGSTVQLPTTTSVGTSLVADPSGFRVSSNSDLLLTASSPLKLHVLIATLPLQLMPPLLRGPRRKKNTLHMTFSCFPVFPWILGFQPFKTRPILGSPSRSPGEWPGGGASLARCGSSP